LLFGLMYPRDLTWEDHENTTFQAETIVSTVTVKLIMKSFNSLKREAETKSCLATT